MGWGIGAPGGSGEEDGKPHCCSALVISLCRRERMVDRLGDVEWITGLGFVLFA